MCVNLVVATVVVVVAVVVVVGGGCRSIIIERPFLFFFFLSWLPFPSPQGKKKKNSVKLGKPFHFRSAA